MTNIKIVEIFLSGFNNPKKLPEAIALLADDYKFKDSTKENHSKAEFLETAKELVKVLTGIEIIKMAENNESVADLYNFKSNIEGLENNLGSEWFRIENGLIKESQLVYDATKWWKVFAQMKD